MNYIEKAERNQMSMLPDFLEDAISESNPVRVIDAFVDSLDLARLGFLKAIPAETGRPAYDPRDLLKLYIYGYFNKIRSSRKLMQECTRNIELMYLLCKLTPDFRTIADFRKTNAKALRQVFREFVKLCNHLKLYNKELLAVDGSKFRAQNSNDKCFNADILKKKLTNIENHIAEYLQAMDRTDDTEEEESLSPEQVKAALQELAARKEKYENYLQQLEDTGETQILETDSEAHRMHTKDGFHCCYNVQTAVDSGSHLIAEYEVTNHNTDQGLLNQVCTQAKALLSARIIETAADKGYESRADILACVMNGTVPHVALKYDKKERVYSLDYRANEITLDEKESTDPKDIQKCIHAGVLPTCYENTAISLEMQNENVLGCFRRNEDNTVTCPMGHILRQTRRRNGNTTYGNRDACRQCQNRCTRSNNPKFVEFADTTTYIAARIYGNDPVKNPLPEGAVLNPYNHVLERKNPKPKKVLLTIRPDKEKLRERMCLSEHPFGTVKWYLGAHYLLCRGKEKVTGEIGLAFLAYNLRRAMNMMGVKKLVEAMKRFPQGVACQTSKSRG